MLEFLRKLNGMIRLFVDAHNRSKFYAEYPGAQGQLCFDSLESQAFRAYISCMLLFCESKRLQVDAVIEKIREMAIYYQAAIPVEIYRRVYGDLRDAEIEYDLQTPDQDSVHITANGWKIAPKRQKFLVPKESLPQVKPVATCKSLLALLQPFVNLSGDDYKLWVCWIVHCFCYGQHLGLVLSAEPGSGKTTLCKFSRAILDPSDVDVVVFPDKIDDLRVNLAAVYMAAFDNVSMGAIRKDASDLLCASITGARSIKRALFTDAELAVLRLQNALIFNGVDVFPAEGDLADRVILLHTKRLSAYQRRTDKDLLEAFEASLPEILGAICNTLVDAMKVLPTLNYISPFRMAEAYGNMLAIAVALGIGQADFERICKDNVNEICKARAVNPTVEAVIEYMQRPGAKAKEEGFVQELYKKIRENYSGSTQYVARSASAFSRKLRKETESLASSGITVNFDDTGDKGTKMTIIKK